MNQKQQQIIEVLHKVDCTVSFLDSLSNTRLQEWLLFFSQPNKTA